MRAVVIDAPAFVAWFTDDPEARAKREEYTAGQLNVIVPRSFTADVLGVVAALGWPDDRMERLAGLIPRAGFDVRDPSTATLTRWLRRGMSPSRAVYAALAEDSERPLVAGDPELRRLAAAVVES